MVLMHSILYSIGWTRIAQMFSQDSMQPPAWHGLLTVSAPTSHSIKSSVPQPVKSVIPLSIHSTRSPRRHPSGQKLGKHPAAYPAGRRSAINRRHL